MKLQYFSDIHLEFGALAPPAIVGDVVIAAGDIGVGLDGLEWLARLDAPVLYVAGNHEYYEHELSDTQARMQDRAGELGIHFLENDTAVVDGVRFLGCTLWSDFDGGSAPIYADALDYMNDFHMIGHGDAAFAPSDCRALSEASQAWLAKTLAADPKDRMTVVVTHHAPTHQSWDARRDEVFRPAYCNRLESLIEAHDIAVWVHGHVHSPCDYTVAGTRVVCNPRGYAGVGPVPGFDPTRTVAL